MPHLCVNEIIITIIWTNAGILLIWALGTNFSEILIEIDIFSFKRMHLKLSSGKWRPFCLDLNVWSLSLVVKGPVLVYIWSSWFLMVLSSQSLSHNPRGQSYICSLKDIWQNSKWKFYCICLTWLSVDSFKFISCDTYSHFERHYSHNHCHRLWNCQCFALILG